MSPGTTIRESPTSTIAVLKVIKNLEVFVLEREVKTLKTALSVSMRGQMPPDAFLFTAGVSSFQSACV
jgi:hypothetical protein